jgi:hypothetical protein
VYRLSNTEGDESLTNFVNSLGKIKELALLKLRGKVLSAVGTQLVKKIDF